MFENGGEPKLIDKKSKKIKRYDSGSREHGSQVMKENFRLVTESTIPALKLRLAPQVKDCGEQVWNKSSPKAAVPFQNSS